MEPQEYFQQDIVFVLLCGGVIMLSVVAAFYLLLRRSNAIASGVTPPLRLRQWAAAFMLFAAVSHVTWIIYIYYPSTLGYTLAYTLDILLFFPTVAGILLSMLQDRKRPVWQVAVALVPVIVLSALSIIRGDDAFLFWQAIYVIVLYASFMVYMFFAVRRYGKWLRDNYADLENKEVWQSFLILAVFLLFFILYSSTNEQNIVVAYLLQIDCIIIVVLLLWRTETLQQLSESITEEEDEPAQEEQKVSAPKAISVDIASLLKKHCENKKLYLQYDLSLSQLALAIGTNHSYLSRYFSQQGLTYNAYINGLRIRHFISLYQKALAEGRTFTAQQLSSESGYHSYSTFSAAFKQYTGKTVTAFHLQNLQK